MAGDGPGEFRARFAGAPLRSRAPAVSPAAADRYPFAMPVRREPGDEAVEILCAPVGPA
jgi:hypothetical protein